jgi:hypothetical protein
MLALGVTGCGSSFQMAPDASVPFAKGEIAASFTDNGNGKMVLKVEHLGDPAKLSASATTYVVWIRPLDKEGVKPVNVGALKIDSDYAGKLEFTTPYRHFEVTITPESAADSTAPAGRDVLKTTVKG